jgi:hypothetical protein
MVEPEHIEQLKDNLGNIFEEVAKTEKTHIYFG